MVYIYMTYIYIVCYMVDIYMTYNRLPIVFRMVGSQMLSTTTHHWEGTTNLPAQAAPHFVDGNCPISSMAIFETI